jgi:hypothetical protein
LTTEGIEGGGAEKVEEGGDEGVGRGVFVYGVDVGEVDEVGCWRVVVAM